MKTKFLTLAFSLGLSGAAMALSPAIETGAPLVSERAPLLAKVVKHSGLMMVPNRSSSPTRVGFTLEVLEDGKVYVTERTLHRGRTTEKTRHAFNYSEADIVRFKRSVNQLNPSRPLIEDPNGPSMCDGGPAAYSVVIAGTETILFEENDCQANRYRQGRSSLEIAVLEVLEDLLDSYYATLR